MKSLSPELLILALEFQNTIAWNGNRVATVRSFDAEKWMLPHIVVQCVNFLYSQHFDLA